MSTGYNNYGQQHNQQFYYTATAVPDNNLYHHQQQHAQFQDPIKPGVVVHQGTYYDANNSYSSSYYGSGSGGAVNGVPMPGSNNGNNRVLDESELDPMSLSYVLSANCRINWFVECIVVIINSIGFPIFLLCLPLSLCGYAGCRWFNWLVYFAFLFPFLAIPMTIADAVEIGHRSDQGTVGKIFLIFLMAVGIFYHLYVIVRHFKFVAVMRQRTDDEKARLKSMDAVWGFL